MMTSTNLPPVEHRPADLVARLAGTDGLVVCLDFDGTLAPVVDDPDEARIDPATRSAVASLADRPGVAVGVVSGRGLADLTGRVGIDGIAYAGNHGLELRRGDGRAVHPIAAAREQRVERVCERLRERVGDVAGFHVENKRLTATAHFRQTPADAVGTVVSAVERAVDRTPGLCVEPGKQIREIRPAVPWDKGDTVRLLAEDAPRGWTELYVGDDVTDEDAFRAVQPEGAGVRVGDPEGSKADYCLADRDDVPPFLEWLDERLADRQE
jgi:trehalose 6-phosphate phosphatase